MTITKKLEKEAQEMLDILGNKNQSLMGLNTEESAYFDILLWLFGDGEKPDVEQEQKDEPT